MISVRKSDASTPLALLIPGERPGHRAGKIAWPGQNRVSFHRGFIRSLLIHHRVEYLNRGNFPMRIKTPLQVCKAGDDKTKYDPPSFQGALIERDGVTDELTAAERIHNNRNVSKFVALFTNLDLLITNLAVRRRRLTVD
jgi:hypothetical protein